MFVNELKEAFLRLVARESHNLLSLTRKTGVNNSTLNRLNASKASFENIPAKTIERLFPRMVVYFFPEDAPQRNEKRSEIQPNLSAAIREAIRRAGSQLALARSCGLSQGVISDYLYGRHKIENMTIGTFDKLFPDAKVDFFGEGPGMDTDAERMSLEYERRILALERKIFELEKQLDR